MLGTIITVHVFTFTLNFLLFEEGIDSSNKEWDNIKDGDGDNDKGNNDKYDNDDYDGKDDKEDNNNEGEEKD